MKGPLDSEGGDDTPWWGPILRWLRGLRINYGRWVIHGGLVAAAMAVLALLAVTLGLYAGLPSGVASAVIAVAGIVVGVYLLSISPILVTLDAFTQLRIPATVRAMALRILRLTYLCLVAAVLIALIPQDAEPTWKLSYTLLSILLAFGISIGTVEMSWSKVNRLAYWKIVTLYLFALFAISFPKTAKASIGLRSRVDAMMGWLITRPLVPNETAQHPVDCSSVASRLWSNSGEPSAWYAKTPAGGFEVFSRSGHHPFRDVELTPVASEAEASAIRSWCNRIKADSQVTQRRRLDSARLVSATQSSEKAKVRAGADAARNEVRKAEEIRASTERRDTYLFVKSLPRKVDYAVFAARSSHQPETDLSIALAKYLESRGKTASGNVFSPAFAAADAFDEFFAGRGGPDLTKMPVGELAARVFLARVTINSVGASTTVDGLVHASLTVHVSVLNSADGRVLDGFALNAVGAGTSESDAIAAGFARVVAQLDQHSF